MTPEMKEALIEYLQLHQETLKASWLPLGRRWRLSKATDQAYKLYKLEEKKSHGNTIHLLH